MAKGHLHSLIQHWGGLLYTLQNVVWCCFIFFIFFKFGGGGGGTGP